ncbi:MAG TPA: hypothetical protein PKD55_22800 [Bellilinea sp.]|nr:hypothetical protein [Bellilinea sp.]
MPPRRADVTRCQGPRRHDEGAFAQRHPREVLTAKLAEDIRDLYEMGKYSQRELGVLYGVSQKQISRIVRRLQWA